MGRMPGRVAMTTSVKPSSSSSVVQVKSWCSTDPDLVVDEDDDLLAALSVLEVTRSHSSFWPGIRNKTEQRTLSPLAAHRRPACVAAMVGSTRRLTCRTQPAHGVLPLTFRAGSPTCPRLSAAAVQFLSVWPGVRAFLSVRPGPVEAVSPFNRCWRD